MDALVYLMSTVTGSLLFLSHLMTFLHFEEAQVVLVEFYVLVLHVVQWHHARVKLTRALYVVNTVVEIPMHLYY